MHTHIYICVYCIDIHIYIGIHIRYIFRYVSEQSEYLEKILFFLLQVLSITSATHEQLYVRGQMIVSGCAKPLIIRIFQSP